MDSLFDQSPRGLAYNVILKKWPELCASFIPKVITVPIDFDDAETAIGENSWTYGPAGETATLGWAVSYGSTQDTKRILISYKSPDGELFSSHIVPVMPNGTEVDDVRKAHYSDEHHIRTPTIESITGLLGYLTLHDHVMSMQVADLYAVNPPKIKGT